MKFTKHIKYLILAVIFFIFSVFSFAYLLNETKKNKEDFNRMEIASQEESFERYDLSALERSLKAIVLEKEELDKHFVKKDNIVDFLNYLEKLGGLVELETKISSVEAVEGLRAEVLEVGIKTLGTFEANYKFLKLLESSNYEIDINHFDLRKQNVKDDGSGLWSSNIFIELLSFVP